jgi:hypothetical protein
MNLKHQQESKTPEASPPYAAELFVFERLWLLEKLLSLFTQYQFLQIFAIHFSAIKLTF